MNLISVISLSLCFVSLFVFVIFMRKNEDSKYSKFTYIIGASSFLVFLISYFTEVNSFKILEDAILFII